MFILFIFFHLKSLRSILFSSIYHFITETERENVPKKPSLNGGILTYIFKILLLFNVFSILFYFNFKIFILLLRLVFDSLTN